jgi:hypothetical protein
MFSEGLRAPYGQPPLTPGRVRRPSSESIVSGMFDTQQMHAMAVMKEMLSMVCRMQSIVLEKFKTTNRFSFSKQCTKSQHLCNKVDT